MAPARIVVVDDEPWMTELISRVLLGAGYSVVALTQPTAALARARAGESFDLAVLDVVMPHLTGEALAAQLRRQNPDLRILYVTGYADALFQARPVLWEGESFLEKPFTPEGLKEAVAMVLYGHREPPTSDA
jgi:CheY-like chemotaxis protein